MKKVILLIVLGCFLQNILQGQDSVFFFISPAYFETGEVVNIPIQTNGFEDIDGYQFSMTWDTSLLEFESIIDFGLPQLTIGSFGISEVEEGILKCSWSGSTSDIESLPDSANVFSIQFLTKGDCDANSTLSFTNDLDPLVFRFDGFNILELPVDFSDGFISNYCELQITSSEVTDNLCFGDSLGNIQINVIGGVPPYIILWNNGQSTINIDSLPQGNYEVTISDSQGNFIDDFFEVEEGQPFFINLGADTIICGDNEYLIEVNSQNPINVLEWFLEGDEINALGVTNFLATESGMYSVVAYDAAGCADMDTVNVEIYENIDLSIDVTQSTLCPGDSTIISVFGGNHYNWIIGNESLSNDTSSSPIAYPNQSTTYTVIASNSCFLDTAQISIDVFENFADAGKEMCIVRGSEIQLNATGGETYEWEETGEYQSSFSISNPVVRPTDSTWYFVYITDEYDCTILDSVLVAVLEDPTNFIKPINILTPNGDGSNDVLEFKGLEKIKNNQITIFNRWGNVVFEKVNYGNDWNGTYKGKSLPAGSYYYVLRMNNFTLKSALTILR